MNKLLASSLALLLLLSSIATARTPLRTKVLKASKNNTLFQNPKGDTSDGAGPAIFVGTLNMSENYIRRGLLALNVAASIPRGSKITEVTLQLTVERTP